MDNSTFSHSPSTRSGSAASAGPVAARHSLQRARHAAHDAVDRLTTGASDLVDRLENKTQGWSEVPQRAWSYSRSTIQDRPVQSLLVALAAGYVVARLLSLRSGR
jgi:ElaB/YqjD/DUF883 family membrane-anchored ribosome-binding protein